MRTLTRKYTDLEYLKECTRNNIPMMLETIQVFLDTVPALVDRIRRGLEKNDWEEIRSAAHALIPAFGIMGMDHSLEKLARTIYDYAGKRTYPGLVRELLQRIDAACAQACEELSEEAAKMKAT